MAESIRSRWTKLDGERSAVLTRARDCAALTIPAILPPEGADDNTELVTPYQSFGAECVNNLASKLLLTMFPPNLSFFRMSMDAKVETAVQQEKGLKTQLMSAFAEAEKRTVSFLETRGFRSPLFQALCQLLVTGNIVVYAPMDRDHHPWDSTVGIKLFRLDEFVTIKDRYGKLIELIIKELVHPASLPKEIVQLVDPPPDNDKPLELYTRVRLEDSRYRVEQGIQDIRIPKSETSFHPDKLPWLVVPWRNHGNYGRGRVEEFYGDFHSYETLCQALVDGGCAAARVVGLVDPAGLTDVRDINKARNMEWVPGREADIAFAKLDKLNDFQFVLQVASGIENRLAKAFLLHTSVTRNAERVTAEEIRFMARELEDALGGQYSVLSQTLQLPIVRLIINRLITKGDIPEFDKAKVFPSITTGIEALGRSHEQSKVSTWIGEAVQLFGPDPVIRRVSVGEYLKRSGNNYGIDTTDLLIPEEEVEAAAQANQLNAAVGGMAPEMVKGMMNAASQQQQQQG